MTNEYKLSYTATQVDQKLGKIDSLEAEIQNLPGVYIGSEEPEGNATVWIDPNGENANLVAAPATAEVGQTIVVKAVDETGKPTEWEAADFPSGGGGTWKRIAKLTTQEDVNGVEWDVYEDGSQIRATKAIIILTLAGTTNSVSPNNSVNVVFEDGSTTGCTINPGTTQARVSVSIEGQRLIVRKVTYALDYYVNQVEHTNIGNPVKYPHFTKLNYRMNLLNELILAGAQFEAWGYQ